MTAPTYYDNFFPSCSFFLLLDKNRRSKKENSLRRIGKQIAQERKTFLSLQLSKIFFRPFAKSCTIHCIAKKDGRTCGKLIFNTQTRRKFFFDSASSFDSAQGCFFWAPARHSNEKGGSSQVCALLCGLTPTVVTIRQDYEYCICPMICTRSAT